MLSSRRNILLWSCGMLLAGVAFARGDYLLGWQTGLFYAIAIVEFFWLIVRRTETPTIASRVGKIVLCLLAIPMVYGMAFPASINSDVQVIIDKQQLDRDVRTDAKSIITRDQRFSDLSVSSVHLKVVNITISGNMQREADLHEFRTQLVQESEAIRKCNLHWDITIDDSGQAIQGLDRDLFERNQEVAER